MKGLIEIIEETRKMKGFLARVCEKKRESFGWTEKEGNLREKWEIIDWLGSKPLIFVLQKEVKKTFLRINWSFKYVILNLLYVSQALMCWID